MIQLLSKSQNCSLFSFLFVTECLFAVVIDISNGTVVVGEREREIYIFEYIIHLSALYMQLKAVT